MARLELLKSVSVQNTFKNIPDLVGSPVILRQQVVEVVGKPAWRRPHLLQRSACPWQILDKLAKVRDARLIVRCYIMRHSTDLSMHLSATQGLSLNRLSGHLFC